MDLTATDPDIVTHTFDFGFGNVPLRPVPIMQFAMDASDLGTDSSGGDRNLSTNANVALVTDADRGLVASFDADNSMLTLPSNEVPSAILGSASRTYMYWIKHKEPLGSHDVGTGGTGNRKWWILINGENTQYINVYDNKITGSLVIPTETWTHLAETHDSGLINQYVNGVASEPEHREEFFQNWRRWPRIHRPDV